MHRSTLWCRVAWSFGALEIKVVKHLLLRSGREASLFSNWLFQLIQGYNVTRMRIRVVGSRLDQLATSSHRHPPRDSSGVFVCSIGSDAGQRTIMGCKGRRERIRMVSLH